MKEIAEAERPGAMKRHHAISAHPPQRRQQSEEKQSGDDPRTDLVARLDHSRDVRVAGVSSSAGTGRRVAFTRTARVVRDGRGDLGDQVGLDDRQRTHLLPDAILSVPLRLVPSLTARHSVRTSRTLRRSTFGGGLKLCHHDVGGERGKLSGRRHPAR